MRSGGCLLLRGFCPSERDIALVLEGLGVFLVLGGSGSGRRGGWGGAGHGDRRRDQGRDARPREGARRSLGVVRLGQRKEPG